MATQTRTRFIETTARLMQARGFHGVSLGDILKESQAPRGSLYFHFPGGKSELCLHAAQAGIDEATQVLDACLRDADHPADGVRAFFAAAAKEMADAGYSFGCPVASIVLDAPDADSELGRLCKAAFAQWTEMYRQAFEAGGAAPDRAARLACTTLAGLEGALMLARSTQSVAPIEQVGEELASLIAHALSP